MSKCRTIGIMTGNSMDAIDAVLTDFNDDDFHDICSISRVYNAKQKQRINDLRQQIVTQKLTKDEILKNREFQQIHQEYVQEIADVVNTMCQENNILKTDVDAIGFHGKTLDHNPPSTAQKNNELPFTIQMGSAQLLANLTNIPTINDFRSALIMSGFEGAPLAPPHNALIAQKEGDGCYINAGNTSNIAWIKNGVAQIGYDSGPFNEYIDSFILRYKGLTMDKDAEFGRKGKILPELVAMLFAKGQKYYDMLPPKSGDPAYYHSDEIFSLIAQKYGNPAEDMSLFCNVMHTFAYFASYIVAYSMGQTPQNIEITQRIILFGGGWKNPLTTEYLTKILKGEAYILPEHKAHFANLAQRIGKNIEIKYSEYGTYMEARLFADMARYYLENKSWPLPELLQTPKKLILGNLRHPFAAEVDDALSSATRGWQQKNK